MAISDLKDAFVIEMQDMLGAEQQINQALQKMSKHASHQDLKEAFQLHTTQTEEQIRRLEEALESIDVKPRGKECPGVAGLIEEAEEMIQQASEADVRDALLIAANQKVEHYEIATYGTLCTWGEQLGFNEAVKRLQETLKQEKATDEKLTKLSQQINREAAPTG